MAFGWSVGDIIAGLKVVQDVWDSVSDGYLNAHYQATSFFDEFSDITQRLDTWKAYKEAISQKDSLAQSYPKLREQCELFIKHHFRLIQESNPGTKGSRQGRRTWLKKANFTREQVATLYAKVTWPTERATVQRLRSDLQYVLNLASFDLIREANVIGRDNQTTLRSISQDHRELVDACRDLSRGIGFIIKQITDPFGEIHQLREVDNSILRQFENALPPPEIIQAIEAPPSENSLPWQRNSLQPAFQTPANRRVLEASTVNDLAHRVNNIGNRLKRVETLDTINETGSDDAPPPPIDELLYRLRYTRGFIQDQVSVIADVAVQQGPSHGISAEMEDPENALRMELSNWKRLGEQMEQDTIHNQSNRPGIPTYASSSARTTQVSTPKRSSSVFSTSPSIPFSPLSSSSDWSSSRHGSLYALPRQDPEFLDRRIPVMVDFPGREHDPIWGFIDSIPGHREGLPTSISTISGDRTITIRHFIQSFNPEANETPFVPYLDNCNVDNDHQFRLKFQGWHSLGIEKAGSLIPATQLYESPNYHFTNIDDFKEFQKILLGKEVKCFLDTISIESSDGICHHEECVRVLLDPQKQTRHILYFEKSTKNGIEHAEWPVSLFEVPKEPPKPKKPEDESRRYRVLKISSCDGKAFSNSRSLSRPSAGSIGPGSPTESSNKKRNRGIKWLEIEFYNYKDCHTFWTEFVAEGIKFSSEVSYSAPQRRDRRRSTIDRSPFD